MLDLSGDKGAVDQRPDAGVIGRLETEQGVRFCGIKMWRVGEGRRPAQLLAGRDMQHMSTEPFVAEKTVYIFPIGKTPMAVVLPVKSRTNGVAVSIKFIRILNERHILRCLRYRKKAHGFQAGSIHAHLLALCGGEIKWGGVDLVVLI